MLDPSSPLTFLRHCTDSQYLLLFRIDKSSLGVSRIGVATPWDDCPYAKSNANTFVRARAYRVFLTSCVGIDLGDIPRGLRHPQDVPSVDPSTLGRKTLYELASLKYCYNTVHITLIREHKLPIET